MKKLTFFPLVLLVLVLSGGCKNKPAAPQDGDFTNTLTGSEISGARLTPEILWKFGRLGEMASSPDGSRIAYTITRYDYKTDKRHTWIYVIPVNGGDPANLTAESASCSNPAWIDNETIAYLSESEGRQQIWKMKADGSGKTVISAAEGDINGFGLTPDGKGIFYLQDVKTDSTTQDMYPDLPLAQGRVIDDLMYRHWDSWSDAASSHIFVARIDVNKIGEGTDIMAGEPFDSPLSPYFDIAEIAWSADGKKLAYTCKKLTGRAFAESTNSDIYLYDIDAKTTVNLTEGMPGYDKYPAFSPDGSKLVFQSMETPGYEADKARMFLIDLNTKAMTDLSKGFDQDAEGFTWSADGKEIYFISGIHATYQVYACNPSTAEISQLTTGNYDYKSVSLAGNLLAGIRNSMSMAPEIFTVDPGNGSQKQLTFINKNIYDALKFGAVKERWVKTTDGKNMLVWLVFPPDFDSTRKYPALLYCQGGPQSAVSQNFSYRWNLQLMAANGYIVVAPNRRGLPSFGQEWNAEISGDYGGQNIRDYLSAIDDAKKEPWVDADHLGAVGASYGGYSVLYLAGCHEKRFKAFIAHCGMFNLESQSAATEEMFFVHHDLGGYYFDKPKPKSYTQFSPHLYVDKWDTPIMLVTGANDFRIPYTESLQAFNVAQLRGIPSKLLFYPNESHWVTKPQNSILWQREFFGWLDKWLK
jgi:dipeptidyl aminopeptidase/acylaminoacyl peptidase